MKTHGGARHRAAGFVGIHAERARDAGAAGLTKRLLRPSRICI
jgi:hypothetical protein